MSEEPNIMEFIELVNGPPFEDFVLKSNLFASEVNDRRKSVIFTNQDDDTMSINVCSISRNSPGNNFTFSGEYYTRVRVSDNNWRYVIGIYDTTKRKGWCYIFTNGYLKKHNPVAALAIGLLYEPIQKTAT